MESVSTRDERPDVHEIFAIKEKRIIKLSNKLSLAILEQLTNGWFAFENINCFKRETKKQYDLLTKEQKNKKEKKNATKLEFLNYRKYLTKFIVQHQDFVTEDLYLW